MIPEILAPVGSSEMLIAAVRAGADAVYLGLNEFNARRNAQNFTLDTLGEAVKYCHIRGVKVYLTLNIMLSDKELDRAVELTISAAKLGIDGVITADIGYARQIKRKLPSLAIHASTQMSVHSPAALKPLKELGFSRVVVAREMSKCELQEFCKKAKEENIEVEVFVHGALCMCVSGQCLLSAMLGGRSGNRGLCAGPCRLPFGCDNGTGYDLSLKDLSLVEHLDELKDMGVASLKIEGRMKRPEYVAAATKACREKIDEGKVSNEISAALNGVFSRSGFTDGYYTGRLGRDMFGIRTKENVEDSASVLSTLHNIYRNERQSVEISAKLSVKGKEPISLTLSDGKNLVTAYGDFPEKAINLAADEDFIKEKLLKTGGTPYIITNVEIELDEGLSLRAAQINELRRKALELLSEERGKTPEIEVKDVKTSLEKRHSDTLKTVIKIDNLSQLTDKVREADLVVLPFDSELSALDLRGVKNFAVELPRGIAKEETVLEKLKKIKEKGIEVALCGTLSAKELALTSGFKVIADIGFNIFNSYSLEYFSKDCIGGLLSSEILLSDGAKLSSSMPIGIMSYGRLPLMLTRNCPIRNGKNCSECQRNCTLTDRKGIEFPVRCKNGFAELLNSKVIWLADRLDELKGIDFQLLSFTDEEPETLDRVIDAYNKKSAPIGEYTRGLYYRGVE
ncbi:MAG: U32 family peptidase [Clostridia bacterium]|nr:U32 family peptidase [Clostridia bacterium]